MKTGPITKARSKRFKDNLAAFILGVIHSQEGLSLSEYLRPVLGIQVVEADTDLSNGFGAFMESGQCEMVPTLHELNEYH